MNRLRSSCDELPTPPIRTHASFAPEGDLKKSPFAADVHTKLVQERLGHWQVSVTLDTYSHLAPSVQREAADQLDALFS